MNRAALLADARIAVLFTQRHSGVPVGLPVWFEWDGASARCFAARDSRKIARLRRDPRASLLVSNSVGEPEGWVAFDGRFEIAERGGFELAERLAPRCWDLSLTRNQAMLDAWRQHPDVFVLLTMRPEQIREGQ